MNNFIEVTTNYTGDDSPETLRVNAGMIERVVGEATEPATIYFASGFSLPVGQTVDKVLELVAAL